MQTTEYVRLRVLLPPMAALSAHPARVIGTFLVLNVLSALFAPDWWDAVDGLKLGTVLTSTVVVGAASGAVGALNRGPRRPREPRRNVARPRAVRRQPPTRIPLAAHRCLICNRPLTDPRSMYNGVGPDCLRNYGARPQTQPNPAYPIWQQRVADARRKAEQAQHIYDREYAVAVSEHRARLRVWEVARARPENVARAHAHRVATRTVAVDAGVLISYGLSELVGQAVGQSGLG